MNTQLIPRNLNEIADISNTRYNESEMLTIWEALSDNTRKLYERARLIYTGQGFRFPCNRQEILDFIDGIVGQDGQAVSVTTIEHYLKGLSFFNRLLGGGNVVDEVVRAKLDTLQRLQHRERRQAHALSLDELDQVLSKIDLGSRKGVRDRALLLTGFYGCMRRSEVIGIDMADLNFSIDGLTINIPVAKTGVNQKVRLPSNCPAVHAIQELITLLKDDGITTGKLFRNITKWQKWGDSLSAVALVQTLKTLATSAGLDSELISGHSLRSGCATALFAQGADSIKIMKHGRWTNPTTVATYYRPNGFADNVLHSLQ